jgi:hypothetical protein
MRRLAGRAGIPEARDPAGISRSRAALVMDPAYAPVPISTEARGRARDLRRRVDRRSADARADRAKVRAEALRQRVDELQAGQEWTYARALAEAQDQLARVREATEHLRQARGRPAGEGACGAAQGSVAGGMMASRCR